MVVEKTRRRNGNAPIAVDKVGAAYIIGYAILTDFPTVNAA
jgi:hypothetical protein